MQHSRFLVLTGHLNDYPLSDLVGILRHQRKTGRLLIEYPNSPGSFFFNEGELVDVQLDNLSGLQALCVAIAQPPSSFNFNPLIRPTRRSIENSLQKVVSELLGCWGENEIEVARVPTAGSSSRPELTESSSLPAEPRKGLDRAPTFLALPPAPPNRFSRPIMATAAAGLLLLGLSTVIAVTGAFGKRSLPAAVPATSHQAADHSALPPDNDLQLQRVPRTESSNNPRVQQPTAKRKDRALDLEQVSRQESRNPPVNTKGLQRAEQTEVASSRVKPDTKAPEGQINEATREFHSVRVVLQIEGGRVAQASIANRRSGMEAYEALALRIARQRRYPSKGPTQEVVTIKLSPPK